MTVNLLLRAPRRASRLGWIAAGWLAVSMAASAAMSPSETVDAFHDAIGKADPARVLELLAPQATFFEQGFAELSRDQWIGNQLKDTMAFYQVTARRTDRRETKQVGDAAWVLSTVITTGNVDGQKLELEGAETAILQQEGGAWKIVHLHWSAHEKAQPAAAAPPAGKKPATKKAPARTDSDRKPAAARKPAPANGGK